jgi:hypothetical protein
MTPAYPHFVHNDAPYSDYEFRLELPSFDDPASDSVANEHSVIIRFTYDTDLKRAYGLVTYEQNGSHQELGDFKLTDEQFYRITNQPIRPNDKLATLRNVKGNITIEDGVATLPDGTQITL